MWWYISDSFDITCVLVCVFRFDIGLDRTRISVVRIGEETTAADATSLSDSADANDVTAAIFRLQVMSNGGNLCFLPLTCEIMELIPQFSNHLN